MEVLCWQFSGVKGELDCCKYRVQKATDGVRLYVKDDRQEVRK